MDQIDSYAQHPTGIHSSNVDSPCGQTITSGSATASAAEGFMKYLCLVYGEEKALARMDERERRVR